MFRRIAAGAAAVVAFVALAALPAFAHVSIQPSEAAKGSYAQLAFRVPNETEDADTTEVKVQLPTDHPFASVSVKPLPGWTITTTKEKLAQPLTSDDGQVTEAVSVVTWSGGKLAPGEYQDFAISVGPLPDDVDVLVFKAIQTYSDGTEVKWIEETPPGGEEPEHPAPELRLTAATGDEHGTGETVETTVPKTSDSNEEAASKSDVDSANSKATMAIALGAVGVIAGIIAIVRSRGGSSPS